MANIRPYDPGELPNRVIGTPGVNQSAGKAEEALSEGVLSIRNAEATLANQSLGSIGKFIGGTLKTAGQLYGDALRAHRAAVHTQKEQMADLAVTAHGHRFTRQANDMLHAAKQTYNDRPEQIEKDFEKQFDGQAREAVRAYEGDPVRQARFESIIQENKTRLMKDVQTWSLDRQYKQAEQLAPNMVAQAEDAISQQTGAPDERYQNFSQQSQALVKSIVHMEPQMGKQWVGAQLHDGLSKLSETYFENQLAERPQDAEQALTHLEQARVTLQGSVEMGFLLDEKKKISFMHQLSAAEDLELKELEYQNNAVHVDNVRKYSQMDFQLYLHRDDSELQARAIQWAENERKDKDRQAAIIDSKLLPDKAKSIAKAKLNSEIDVLKGIVQTAHTNQRYLDAVKRQDAAEARQLEIEREKLATEKRRLAMEQLKVSQTEAKTNLVAKKAELAKLMLNVSGNRDKVYEKAAEVEHYSRTMLEAGYLSPEEFGSGETAAIEAMAEVGKYRAAPTLLFPNRVESLTKPKKFQELQANREVALKKMEAIRQRLDAQTREAARNITVGKLSTAQQTEYDKWAPQILSSNMSQAAKQLRLNQLRSDVMRDFPPDPKESRRNSPPPPKPLGSSKTPEGYNGNIDITQRPVVDFANGLDETNSTPAARRQFSSDNFAGSFGTEYSTRITDGDHDVSIPTIINGKLHSTAEAVEHYKKTGQYLGRFPKGTPESAMEDYENRVHNRTVYVDGKPYRKP